MYLSGNAKINRGSVTINHGTSIAATARADFTASFPGAEVGDNVVATPQAVPATGVGVLASPRVTTAGVVTVSLANLTGATQAAGTAVGYNITLIKPTGNSNT